tara:strand:+ start:40119 stop:40607 length:489 start_codon:yes stop_codon:yes gene_type:complete
MISKRMIARSLGLAMATALFGASHAMAQTLDCQVHAEIDSSRSGQSTEDFGTWRIELTPATNRVVVQRMGFYDNNMWTRNPEGVATRVSFTDDRITFCPVAEGCDVANRGSVSISTFSRATINRRTGNFDWYDDTTYVNGHTRHTRYTGRCDPAAEAPPQRF